MRKDNKFFRFVLFITIGVIAANAFWFGWLKETSFGGQWASEIFSSSGRLGAMISAATRWRGLESENSELKSLLAAETAERAEVARLKSENERLRSALGLQREIDRDIILANIFDVSLAPDGYSAMLNKGSRDGVAQGDTVAGEDSTLLGVVREVFLSSAKVMLVSDPSFKVTVGVLGGQVKGIAKGALVGGMTIDLVVQNDQIEEGDLIISSGDDMVPAGLIVGTVSRVQENNAKLFKEVFVTPAANLRVGSAYILK